MAKSWVVTPLLPFILPLLGMPFGVLKANQIDTLDLQYQWSYPLSVIDMKLADFDQDGAAEILVGFNSDSARVGVLDAATETLTWQSFGMPGEVLCVAAGDRNSDDHLDIAAGGWMPGGFYGGGCLRLFDGPTFDWVSTVGPIDQAVTSAGIFRPATSDTAAVIAGTRWDWDDDTYYPVHWFFYTEGHLFSYDGAGLALLDSTLSGQVRAIDAIDVDGDSDTELITAEEHLVYVDHHGGTNSEMDTLNIRVADPDSSLIINIHSGHVGFNDLDPVSEASIDAFEAGDILGSGAVQIIASWRGLTNGAEPRPANVSCFDGITGDTIWSVADSVNPGYISGLAICDLSSKSARTVCAAYSSGSIRYKSGLDGSDLAVSIQLPAIGLLAVGNVDHDDAIEICIASAESVYVYEAPFITTDVHESVHQARPNEFSLHQNYPNPFNPETVIHFTVPKRSGVKLTIYDVSGRRVRSFVRNCQPGTHGVMWDGKNSSGETVASGVYFYRLTTGDYEETRKMVLLR
jgi:hypothetical protein